MAEAVEEIAVQEVNPVNDELCADRREMTIEADGLQSGNIAERRQNKWW